MALNPESKEIRQALNQFPDKIFPQVVGMPIRSSANLISNPEQSTAVRQNPRSIADPFASLIAFCNDLQNPDPAILKDCIYVLKTMYAMVADADYRGVSVTYNIHVFKKEDDFDQSCIEHLQERTGWNQMPDRVLVMNIGERACAIFDPQMRMFIPGAGFSTREKAEQAFTERQTGILKNECGEQKSNKIDTDRYLSSHPKVKDRYHAFLTNMAENHISSIALNLLLSELGGVLPPEKMKIYRGEMLKSLSGDVLEYLQAVTGAEPDAARAFCCMPGTNTVSRLLEEPAFLLVGEKSQINAGMACIGTELVVIPPTDNCSSITGAKYDYADDKSYLEFTAFLDETLYHKIYHRPSGGWKIFQPEDIIDMFYGVPDWLLSRHNYLIQQSMANSKENHETAGETIWEIYPEDPTTIEATLESKQAKGSSWTVLQRTLPISMLKLTDNEGHVLGTVIPPVSPAFKKENNTMYISLDPAGAESVRLATIAGSRNISAVPDSDLLAPLTPMSEEALKTVEKFRAVLPRTTGLQTTHFASLLQNFDLDGTGDWARLMIESRIFQQNQEELFTALQEFTGDMTDAMTAIGVVSNPKEMISRSDLTPENRAKCIQALNFYIGILLLEGIFKAAKKGFSIQHGNLQLLISYPENGSGQSVTRLMKEAIEGAIQLINEYLTPSNHLAVGSNVTLYSESEATNRWHEEHPPTKDFLGGSNATGTPDCGFSTHDYSLRVNRHLYLFSLPYAAQQLTNATLAKVYDGNDKELMRCFHGGSQQLMKETQESIKRVMNPSVMNSSHGKLYERLGFVLALNRLFSECNFQVTGANADHLQLQVQQIVEAKLNIAIPAYADTMVRAIRAGDLHPSENLMLAPVGKGSLAMNNTGEGFEKRFTERLRAEINAMLGDSSEPYTGEIQLLPNNDTRKVSVAEGMILLKERGTANRPAAQIVEKEDPTEYYLSIICGDDEEAKQSFLDQLETLNGQATRRQFLTLKEQIYDKAFDAIIRGYTYEMFEESFNRFGYTGTGDGSFDEALRTTAKDHFANICSQLLSSRKDLIMSCPGIEKELLCGAVIDLALER